jgi:negative regulator of genetic competence, sporulation and motility
MAYENVSELMEKFPVEGQLNWISVRPERKQVMVVVNKALVDVELGLLDDHYAGRS